MQDDRGDAYDSHFRFPRKPDARDDAALREPLAGEGRRVPIAQFVNVAEAGYFAEELAMRIAAPVEVRAESGCDGMDHVWRTEYRLVVLESLGDEASQALQELLAENRPEAEETAVDGGRPEFGWPTPSLVEGGRSERFEIEPSPRSGVNWIPIVLTLTAGSAVLWALRSHLPNPLRDPPAAGPAADLWQALTESPEPLRQTVNAGRGTRELTFDARRRKFVLREDQDGDGRFERVREFDRAPAEVR